MNGLLRPHCSSPLPRSEVSNIASLCIPAGFLMDTCLRNQQADRLCVDPRVFVTHLPRGTLLGERPMGVICFTHSGLHYDFQGPETILLSGVWFSIKQVLKISFYYCIGIKMNRIWAGVYLVFFLLSFADIESVPWTPEGLVDTRPSACCG